MPEKVNRAVAYVRVSDDDQMLGESIDTQKQFIQDYADKNDLYVVKWFTEEGKTAKNARRPALQELLKYATDRRNRVDTVVFYKLNRASRNLQSYFLDIKRLLDPRGIKVKSASERVVEDTMFGRYMEGMLVLNAQLDNEVKSSVVKDNMSRLAQQGWWMTGPKLGYDIEKVCIGDYNGKKKYRNKLSPSTAAPLLKTVLERYSSGDITKSELTRFAKDVGLRSVTGKVLTPEQINRLLEDVTYAGFVKNKHTDGVAFDGKHDAIISLETFELNQVISSRKKKTVTSYKKMNPLYPLKGVLVCSNCNQPLRGSAPKTGGGKSYSPRYHCPRIECRNGVTASIKADVVHKLFRELLANVKPSDELKNAYKTILLRQAIRVNGRTNQKIESKRNELSAIDKRRLKAIEARTLSDNDSVQEQQNELIANYDLQRIDLKNSLSELEEQQSIQQAHIEYIVNTMDKLDRQWEDADFELKLRFQKMVFPEGVVFDTKKQVFGTDTISHLYRYLPNKKDLSEVDKSLLVTSPGIEPELPG